MSDFDPCRFGNITRFRYCRYRESGVDPDGETPEGKMILVVYHETEARASERMERLREMAIGPVTGRRKEPN